MHASSAMRSSMYWYAPVGDIRTYRMSYVVLLTPFIPFIPLITLITMHHNNNTTKTQRL